MKFNRVKLSVFSLIIFLWLFHTVAKAEVGCNTSSGNPFYTANIGSYMGETLYDKTLGPQDINRAYCSVATGNRCHIRLTDPNQCNGSCDPAPPSIPPYPSYYYKRGLEYNFQTNINCPLDDYVWVLMPIIGMVAVVKLRSTSTNLF